MSAPFDTLRRRLQQESGIALDADKAYLADSRLAGLMETRQIKDLAALVQLLERGSDRTLLASVVEAMTTNETLFFRDRTPFDTFRDVLLPRLLETRHQTRTIRIWCAAASTGQEPYSLAMILDEQARSLTGWQVEILATDLSRKVIDAAKEGLYNQFEVQRGLPIALLLRHFKREGEMWRINEHLRARVAFRTHNLLSDVQDLGTFDVIFCRNVLIYFDLKTKERVLASLAQALKPDGYLCLGTAETAAGLSNTLRPHPQYRMVNVHAATARAD